MKTTCAGVDRLLPGDVVLVKGVEVRAVLEPGDRVLVTKLAKMSAAGVYRLNEDGTFSRETT